jgi:hypothetical protein
LWLLWLREGRGDGGGDEVEGVTLVCGGLGEDGHGRVGAGEGDVVAGVGGEVVE